MACAKVMRSMLDGALSDGGAAAGVSARPAPVSKARAITSPPMVLGRAHEMPVRRLCMSSVTDSALFRFIVVIRGFAFGEAVEDRVESGHQEQREKRGHREATDDGARQGEVRLAPFADAERHRYEPEHGGDGGHQDRPEARAP